MSGRTLLALAGVAFAAGLVAALVGSLGISAQSLGDAILATPLWLVAAITLTTLLNQFIGVARWHAAISALSPHAPHIGFADKLAATTLGAVFGQLLPTQASLALARWLAARGIRGGWVVGTTFYEQLFDLVVLVAGAIGGLALLKADAGVGLSAIVLVIAIGAGCLGMHRVFSMGHRLALALSGADGFIGRCARRLADPLARAHSAPPRVVAVLAVWSVLRIILLAFRTVLVAMVFAPKADLVTVAIGYPLTGLALAAPVLPAGLGVGEWTWTGVLVLAGCAPKQAGIAALSMRVVNFVGLLIVALAVLAVWFFLKSPQPLANGRAQKQQVRNV